jgi:hypothetical protein
MRRSKERKARDNEDLEEEKGVYKEEAKMK